MPGIDLEVEEHRPEDMRIAPGRAGHLQRGNVLGERKRRLQRRLAQDFDRHPTPHQSGHQGVFGQRLIPRLDRCSQVDPPPVGDVDVSAEDAEDASVPDLGVSLHRRGKRDALHVRGQPLPEEVEQGRSQIDGLHQGRPTLTGLA